MKKKMGGKRSTQTQLGTHRCTYKDIHKMHNRYDDSINENRQTQKSSDSQDTQ